MQEEFRKVLRQRATPSQVSLSSLVLHMVRLSGQHSFWDSISRDLMIHLYVNWTQCWAHLGRRPGFLRCRVRRIQKSLITLPNVNSYTPKEKIRVLTHSRW